MPKKSIRGFIAIFTISYVASASAANIPVTNLDDSGPGSFRQAILDANDEGAYPGQDIIDLSAVKNPNGPAVSAKRRHGKDSAACACTHADCAHAIGNHPSQKRQTGCAHVRPADHARAWGHRGIQRAKQRWSSTPLLGGRIGGGYRWNLDPWWVFL